MTEEFLRHLDVVQSAKRCAGKDCQPVSKASLEAAKAVDDARVRRPGSCVSGACKGEECSYCDDVLLRVDGLAANLGADGIEVPKNLL